MQMRRGFSILLILFLGLGPLSAMVPGSEDANLPACCRRNGAHHCAMNMQMAAMMAKIADPRPAFSAPLTCPLYPGPSLMLLMPAHALATAHASAQIASTQSIAPVFARVAAHSSPSPEHSGRAPPASHLS